MRACALRREERGCTNKNVDNITNKMQRFKGKAIMHMKILYKHYRFLKVTGKNLQGEHVEVCNGGNADVFVSVCLRYEELEKAEEKLLIDL